DPDWSIVPEGGPTKAPAVPENVQRSAPWQKCELDGRGEDVVLTGEGRRAHDRAAPVHLDAVRRHLTGALSPEQLAAFTAIARRLAP
ncbi:MarR family winged helix-turn-helix transcriptional regulator, partial [Nonomuraea sp. NPDC055795]